MEKKQGFPQEGELVLATVTNIHYHSAFCSVDEYSKKGMIHISEIAPGRIKQISDYLREGKTVICKVLKVDEKKGHVDLSLRRVTEAQRRQKSSEIKQTQIVDKIFTQFKQAGGSEKQAQAIQQSILTHTDVIYEAFQGVVDGEYALKDLGVADADAKLLKPLILDRIKPRAVEIKGELNIQTYTPNGVEQIQTAFKDTPEDVIVSYLGAGRYAIAVHAKEYRQAEATLKTHIDHITDALGSDAEVAFERAKK